MPRHTLVSMEIPGWTVTRDEVTGVWTAEVHAALSDYQDEHGALARLEARDPTELLVLAAAHSELARQLVGAELLARAERQRRAARAVNGTRA